MGMKWKLAAVSVTGLSHVADETACEDAFFVDQADNGFVVGVVSDGAGSARFGGDAARLICEHFRQFFGQLAALEIDGGREAEAGADDPHPCWSEISRLLEGAFDAARLGLLDLAAANDAEPADFLATLVGAVAHPLLGATIFHIGDGAASLFDPSGGELHTSQPENGEYLNQTYFLVEDHWKQHLRINTILQQLGEIFIMTDGVTDLGYVRSGRTLAPEERFFRPLSAFLDGRSREAGEAALVRTLDSDAARERVDDDKTVIWMRLLDSAVAE